MSAESNETSLSKNISLVPTWAFAVGTSIGWGSFFITSNTYLAGAGPLGSILGLVIGAVIMLFVAHNYQFLMNKFQSSGGAYSYTKEVLGHDYAFLVATFLILTYLAMFWANATSLPLFARYFFGDFFKVGECYSIFGYKVFLGEALLSIFAILVTALICSKTRKFSTSLNAGLVIFFVVGILVCFFTAIFKHGGSSFSYKPAFVPSGKEMAQVLKIAFISPWAFIGFENISHFVPEFKFSSKKSGTVLHTAVITTTILYIALILLSVSAYPAEYQNWFEYISNMGNIEGVHGLPVFYAATHYMGDTGFYILMFALLALILTSLIGNIYALSRLIFALSEDEVVPKIFSKLSKNAIPSRAVRLVAIISCFMPFLGRTAIGWIVDVTTIGATIIYGFLSFVTFKIAKKDSSKAEVFTGIFALSMMLIFFIFLVIPTPFSRGTISSESYFLFSVWSILGFMRFHFLLKNDKKRIYGRSNIVWMFLLSLILVLTLVWLVETDRNAVESGFTKVHDYIHTLVTEHWASVDDEAYLALSVRLAFENVLAANLKTTFTVIAFSLITALIILSNSTIISKREIEHEHEISVTRNIAFTDSLTGVKSKHAYAEYETDLNMELEQKLINEFAVVVCDVNNLKWVNDNLGHKAGDEYIKEACHLICFLFDHSPVFRTGGDEFVVILKGYDYEHRTEILGELNKVSEENNGRNGKVVVAAGIAEYESANDKNYTTVFERADANMYVRKKQLKAMVK